jgi:hypothetical protein
MAELKMMEKMCLEDVNQMTINTLKHKGKVARDIPFTFNHSTCALESRV